MIRQIPRGRVATYGLIASLAGFPRNARQVGAVLKKLPPDTAVPWHRVVNSQGQISLRASSVESKKTQRELLENEGVKFSSHASISLKDFIWRII